MKNKKLYMFFILILLAFTTTGCIGVDKSFKNLRSKVMKNVNDKFEKTIEFSLGKSAFLLFGKFMNSDEEENEKIKDMLKEVSHISIGIYEKENSKKNFADTKSLKKLINKISDGLEVDNWTNIVKANRKEETVGIYIKENESEKINEMFAVIISDDEMVMLKLNGNLDSLADKVIKQQGFGTRLTDRN